MLAIVIPYYKISFFEATLESLADQTDKRFKVYIGNDDSPEDPTQLLDTFQGNFEFVYHKFEENLGSISLVKQWDRCINLTLDEEWYMILGDDDALDETVVASWYKNYEHFNLKSNLVRFASKLIFEKSNCWVCAVMTLIVDIANVVKVTNIFFITVYLVGLLKEILPPTAKNGIPKTDFGLYVELPSVLLLFPSILKETP